MKAFLIFAICFVAVSADITSDGEKELEKLNKLLSDSSSEVRKAVQRCLENYNISNHIVIPTMDEKTMEDFVKLTEEQQYCVLYCSYDGKGEVKDGTLDIDKVSVGQTPAEKVQFANIVSQCRVEHPGNNCQFMKCVTERDLQS